MPEILDNVEQLEAGQVATIVTKVWPWRTTIITVLGVVLSVVSSVVAYDRGRTAARVHEEQQDADIQSLKEQHREVLKQVTELSGAVRELTGEIRGRRNWQ
jgi:predicted histidine transporter YuiF (NhaC family)